MDKEECSFGQKANTNSVSKVPLFSVQDEAHITSTQTHRLIFVWTDKRPVRLVSSLPLSCRLIAVQMGLIDGKSFLSTCSDRESRPYRSLAFETYFYSCTFDLSQDSFASAQVPKIVLFSRRRYFAAYPYPLFISLAISTSIQPSLSLKGGLQPLFFSPLLFSNSNFSYYFRQKTTIETNSTSISINQEPFVLFVEQLNILQFSSKFGHNHINLKEFPLSVFQAHSELFARFTDAGCTTVIWRQGRRMNQCMFISLF